MSKQLFSVILLFFSCSFTISGDFKSEQIKNSRVKTAYNDKGDEVLNKLRNVDIRLNELQILIQVFKEEQEVELWGKNRDEENYRLVESFSFCTLSGELGPKRKQGDRQVPEGFYHIDRFNPTSNFFLSLGINYPNESDRILGKGKNLGGDIFIHGDCVTIGCIPITDDKIKELYIYALESANNGQKDVPVYIFPARFTMANCEKLLNEYAERKDLIEFWTNLKEGYDRFQIGHKEPIITVTERGYYKFE